MAVARQARPLHELLLEQGAITPEALKTAQAEAARTGAPLRHVLAERGLVSDAALTACLSAQSGVPSVDLASYVIKPELVQLVPEGLARKHVLMPIFKIGSTLTLAVSDPFNFFAIDEVRLRAKCDIKTMVASESSIRQAIEQHYSGETAGTPVEVLHAAGAAPAGTSEEAAESGAVITLVDQLIAHAMKERASDIHLEPGEGGMRTRFRVDGLLQEVAGPPGALHGAVVSRIKVLAKLDIAEKRKPQDGRFRVKLERGEIDLRVSTAPTQHGEKVVLRLLDSATAVRSLEQLGMEGPLQTAIERAIRVPHGILLVTGPTGSGKTTTLYTMLQLINAPTLNIMTIEDPVEYQLRGVNQVQVNPKAEVTFASALRSFLRQDPDVIMVGEIRDRETAEIAIQAALTGHLVLSTLHTNDAASALTRLADMGVEPFLIASSVSAVLAQRLVRAVCPKCKVLAPADAGVCATYGLPAGTPLAAGSGCAACKQRGYKGRVGMFEFLAMTPALKDLVVSRAAAHALQDAARQGGMRSMMDDGLAKARAGLTTVEEIARVTQLG